jgi:uroporphyrinogen decarboxylase
MTTPRELVRKTLEFRSPERVPRQIWTSRWAKNHYKEELAAIQADFPDDIVMAGGSFRTPLRGYGVPSAVGTFIDEWGCIYTNIQQGIAGEVKDPLITDLNDLSKLREPVEILTLDADKVNEACAGTDRFVITAASVRPFERLQFILGSENAYIALGEEEDGLFVLLDRLHRHYKKEIESWCRTDIDGLWFMDDWGSQRSLLISPEKWRRIFKPMYKDYIDILHLNGKKAFFHSDGYTLDIVPEMIELGTDAINLQIFCIGLDKLRQYKGKITFWGEIDRQHILADGTPDDNRRAVLAVRDALYDPSGGVIAQCEFGPGARPENVRAVFETWNRI